MPPSPSSTPALEPPTVIQPGAPPVLNVPDATSGASNEGFEIGTATPQAGAAADMNAAIIDARQRVTALGAREHCGDASIDRQPAATTCRPNENLPEENPSN